MKTAYWADFWRDHGKKTVGADDQTQVLRTLNKEPISDNVWNKTVSYIQDQLALQKDHSVLDLCCGNGLLTAPLAEVVHSVTSVDVSPDLVEAVCNRKLPNVETVVADIRDVDFDPKRFDRIVVYAGIQYLSFSETVSLFEGMARWLKSPGLLFVGDIPDRYRMWNFFNTEERESVHFSKLSEGSAVVGSWFEQEWLLKLARHAGFRSASILPQRADMIYSTFRFDMKALI